MEIEKLLKFEYNLNITNINIEKNFYTFYIDFKKMYLVEINFPIITIEMVLKDLSDVINNYHRPILNNDGKIFTMYEKKQFILLKPVTFENDELDLLDLIKNQIPTSHDYPLLNRKNWGELWSKKVDYLEYQVSELADKYRIIRESFSYYVGLAENAIQYFNTISDKDNLPLYYSHRKIDFPNIAKHFFNPIDIVIDYKSRDVAEYIKSAFFNSNIDLIKEVNLLLNTVYLTPKELNLLFVRLLYPSYYFNGLQEVFDNNEKEDSLITYIEKINDYEKFLNSIYHLLSKKTNLIKIDWLIKEHL